MKAKSVCARTGCQGGLKLLDLSIHTLWRWPLCNVISISYNTEIPALKMCKKFTGEYPCRSAISIK